MNMVLLARVLRQEEQIPCKKIPVVDEYGFARKSITHTASSPSHDLPCRYNSFVMDREWSEADFPPP
jgi:hypothetical protein